MPCPTSRDFFTVDAQQSSGLISSYIITKSSLIAQNTITNMKNLGIQVLSNLTNIATDEVVLADIITALGCTQWKVKDLTDPNNVNNLTTLATNEIQAAAYQASPIALVPNNDLMTIINGQQSVQKVNAYRSGCDQPGIQTLIQADGTAYCQNLYYVTPKRLNLNSALFSKYPSPNPNIATNLYAFLCYRFSNTFGPNGLNCLNLLNVNAPVIPIFGNNTKIVVNCQIIVPTVPTFTTMPSNSQTKSTSSRINANLLVIFILVTIIIGLNYNSFQ